LKLVKSKEKRAKQMIKDDRKMDVEKKRPEKSVTFVLPEILS